ncbi:tetratricopeptide repeat protein [Poritiphilus flavus]|uniref:Tetratricopeptide repeat-containing protein n=1 Tax=Poritiphilus flavus TaxID=2697053 RepID=A0A6L9E8J6_9FLAO|nr:hypothetical protein [Poritiphilus flavus]NAS10931.1 hypothetical protein [Poritiphilus flavus]
MALSLLQGFAQEDEESAEVFLEDYTDEFQENFFEALKQKGIENYDKAINRLLECKRLDEENRVVDHELAKVYLADRQLVKALDYGIIALNSEPENLWYLNTLVEIVQKQGSTIDHLKNEIPLENVKLKEHLALIYYDRKDYQNALAILKQLKSSSFSEDLTLKIRDSLQKKEIKKEKRPEAVENTEAGTVEGYRIRISEMIEKSDFKGLKQLATEAVDNFPSQPFFYYAQGLALHKTGQSKQAIGPLESALDYLLDDIPLANKIYSELASCYKALGNSSKANMYLSKIKSGS